ncbi:unnamed protein product, partial [Sphacelaria rigidula]
MVRCEADPCVFKMEDEGDVRVILVVHVDDILISGPEEYVGKVGQILNKKFPTNNLGEVTWYMGCAVDRDWGRSTLSVTQTTFTDTLLKRFEVRGYSEIPASVSVKLGSTTGEDKQVNRPYRNAVGRLVWLATVTRPDIANSKAHDGLSVYCDADYAKKETDWRSVSGVAVMYGGVVVSATSRTQHCVTLSTTEAEYVAMAEGAKEGLFVKAVL